MSHSVYFSLITESFKLISIYSSPVSASNFSSAYYYLNPFCRCCVKKKIGIKSNGYRLSVHAAGTNTSRIFYWPLGLKTHYFYEQRRHNFCLKGKSNSSRVLWKYGIIIYFTSWSECKTSQSSGKLNLRCHVSISPGTTVVAAGCIHSSQSQAVPSSAACRRILSVGLAWNLK